MNVKFFRFAILISGMAVSGVLLGNALAQTASDIQYPVKELANCQDEAACRVYCDKPQNLKVCLNFAEKNNLMPPEELQQAKNFLNSGGEGPGGCVGKDSCEEYCNDISHIDECISFAEENNLIPPEELEEAKKVQAAIKRGVKPPPCGSKKQCDIYCSESGHMEECIAFGIEAGFIQGEELEDVQKMLAALKRGIKPPPCKGKQACDEYCSAPDNMEICMNFAMEAGFMAEEEKADAQKILEVLKKGIKPPNCRGKEECDVYCAEESHFEECMKFAEAAGFMSPEDAEMARKTGGKGPGGCKGKDECEAFCGNPDNQETCFNFAKEHGLIPEEDLLKMEEGKQKMQEVFRNAPPEALECLKSTVGTEIFDKIQAGTLMPGPQIGDQVRQCFEQYRPNGPGPENGAPGNGGFMPPNGGTPDNMAPGITGPGGCASPEECQKYCESNPEACGDSRPPVQPMPRPGGAPMPDYNPAPCQGENCPPSPQDSRQYQPPQQPIQPGMQVPPEGFVQPPQGLPADGTFPPPSTAPGAGGEIQPPPTEEQPTSFLNSFLGLIFYPFILLFR